MVMLPFASGVLYPALHWQLPALGAGAAMICSSLCVVGSSLLLRLFKPLRLSEIVLSEDRSGNCLVRNYGTAKGLNDDM
jgi:hypothetical protein